MTDHAPIICNHHPWTIETFAFVSELSGYWSALLVRHLEVITVALYYSNFWLVDGLQI